MSDKNLSKFAESFMSAAMQDLNSIAAKLPAARENRDIMHTEVLKVTMEFYDITQGALKMENLLAELGVDANDNQEYQDICLKTADKLAGIIVDISLFNELAKHMPQDAKTASISQAYAVKGALNLSKLAKS